MVKQVRPEPRGLRERLPAEITNKRLLPRMRPHMVLQQPQPREPLLAQLALVRLLRRMPRYHMPLQVTTNAEPRPAHLATVRLLQSVRAHMLVHPRIPDGLVAHLADAVAVHVLRVLRDPPMLRQLLVRPELREALLALVRRQRLEPFIVPFPSSPPVFVLRLAVGRLGDLDFHVVLDVAIVVLGFQPRSQPHAFLVLQIRSERLLRPFALPDEIVRPVELRHATGADLRRETVVHAELKPITIPSPLRSWPVAHLRKRQQPLENALLLLGAVAGRVDRPDITFGQAGPADFIEIQRSKVTGRHFPPFSLRDYHRNDKFSQLNAESPPDSLLFQRFGIT